MKMIVYSLCAGVTGALAGAAYSILFTQHLKAVLIKKSSVVREANPSLRQKASFVGKFAGSMLLRYPLLLAILISAWLCCREYFGVFAVCFIAAFLAKVVINAKERA